MLNNISTSSSRFSYLQGQPKTGQTKPTESAKAPALEAQPQAKADSAELLPNQRVALAAAPASTQTQNAIRLLKKPPFKPTDVNMFSSIAYPNAKPMKPAPKKSMTSLQVKAQLTKTFNKRFNGNKTRIKEAIALMDSPSLKKYVPDPKLRGAIVNLKGTVGEPAIDAYRKGVFGKVEYKNLANSPYASANGVSILLPGQTKRHIWINDRTQGEDLRLLSSTMAHEALHPDTPSGEGEELVNSAIDSLIYGKLVAEDPTLAQSGTELARRQNTKLLARLNSRDSQGELRLFSAQGSNVWPGSKEPLKNFAGLRGLTSPSQAKSTPGNATLRAILKNITGKTLPNANFDANTLKLLDQSQKVLTPVALVNIAKTLKLNIGK